MVENMVKETVGEGKTSKKLINPHFEKKFLQWPCGRVASRKKKTGKRPLEKSGNLVIINLYRLDFTYLNIIF